MHFNNQVQLVGRAGADASSELLTDGSRISRLRLYQPPPASRADSGAPAFQVVAWNAVAEQMDARVRRGDRLLVQGKLVNRRCRYGDTEYVRTEVHLSHFAVLASPSRGNLTVSPNREP